MSKIDLFFKLKLTFSQRSIKWAEVEGSFCKTPLTYRWLIWFRSMLSSTFLKSDPASCTLVWAPFWKFGWRHHISSSGCGPDCWKPQSLRRNTILTFMTQRGLIRANLVVTPVQTIRILPYLHFNPYHRRSICIRLLRAPECKYRPKSTFFAQV